MDLRFASTLQVMLSLALAQELDAEPTPSSSLAEGLGVPSSLVRRLITPIVKRGLVVASLGKNGGLRLARAAQEITLDEVYDAVFESSPIWEQRKDLKHRCLVTTNVEAFLSEVDRDACNAVRSTLIGKTLTESLDRMRKLEIGSAARSLDQSGGR